MLYKFDIKTDREGLYDITSNIRTKIEEENIKSGICIIYCPHTTGGITINEGADPDVKIDLLLGLEKAFPDRKEFRHMEGNSSAHLKSSAVGCEKTIIIENGRLLLGTWQSIYFCEFDGPRNRNYYLKIIKD